ncbi:MAG: cytidine deaminase [Kiritimatiellae bacterium]|nr:cytidine deaminase [Kiritimatiellia bacterium]
MGAPAIDWDALGALARAAAARAHAPYSGFRVGAALLDADGAVHTGCNVENASYGLSNCAERTALFKAVSEGRRRFCAIAIAGGTASAPAFPCGACRQALAEFCGPETPVAVFPLEPDGGKPVVRTLGEYLPFSFSLGGAGARGGDCRR